MKRKGLLLAACLAVAPARAEGPLVLQSDFGVEDAAVASMKGVAASVSTDLSIHDLTHEIPVYDIWEASLRLGHLPYDVVSPIGMNGAYYYLRSSYDF